MVVYEQYLAFTKVMEMYLNSKEYWHTRCKNNKRSIINLHIINFSKLGKKRTNSSFSEGIVMKNSFFFSQTGTEIGFEGIRMITDALKSNNTLTDLDLSCQHEGIIVWFI